MIGQTDLKSLIASLKDRNKWPHFVLIVGDEGSGKKTICKEFFPQAAWIDDITADGVRKMLEVVYTTRDALFVIPDADEMSQNAQNELLKVIEECPNNSSFIMTIKNEANILSTIKSRAMLLHMSSYYKKELEAYYDSISDDAEHRDMVISVCSVPGDVKQLLSYGAERFYNYVAIVAECIATVSGSNVFKIGTKLAVARDAEGYDLRLFWKAFASIVRDKMMEAYFTENDYNKATAYQGVIEVTDKFLQILRKKGINKQMLLDRWILEVREILMPYVD